MSVKQALTAVPAAISILLTATCVSCAQDQTQLLGQFDLVFRYGVGAGNVLDTAAGTFIKDMVRGEPVKTRLQLTKEEKDRIHRKMLEINFFSYPDRFVSPAVKQPGDGAVQVAPTVTPAASYVFEVTAGTTARKVAWTDNSLGRDEKSVKLRDLAGLIISIVESKEAYKKLPPARGGYL